MQLISNQSLQYRIATPQINDRKRKQQQEGENKLYSTSARKKQRASSTHLKEGASDVEIASCATEINPIGYWRKEGRWPKEYFEADDQTREHLNRDLDEENWLKNYWIPEMEYPLARKKSSSSLRRVQSQPDSAVPSSITPSDQKPREEKSAPYKHPGYKIELAKKGSFMDEDEKGIAKEKKELCQGFLETEQKVPGDSLFRDDLFKDTCREIQDRNEAKVIQDITRLIVPSARHLAIRGAKHLKVLAESVNEGWNNSIPLTKTRPQPDYAVGIGRAAFTEEQLNKLQPFVGELTDTSYFMATWYMYFPFLTCEVKCGAAALDVADRQNTHSMTLAVRGVVEMFKLVKRQKEIDREILAFSVSHDDRCVRIYGHYPVIDGKTTTFYRYPIREFSFTELDGKEKWTAYKFTKNVYDKWMPGHLERLLSAIDQIPPNINFELSESASFSQEPQASQQSISSVTMLEGGNSQPSLVGSQEVTPNTSFTDQPFKKPRKKRAAE